jgi:hypothetical protein
MSKHKATVSGSNGTITIDNTTGNVLSFTDAYNHEAHEYKDLGITRFDLLEHYLFWNGRDGKRYQRVDQYDILDLGYWWEKDGLRGYTKPEADYRRECEIAKPYLNPDGDLGRILGQLLSSGTQFAFSYTPFKYDGKGAVNGMNPNVTLWSEDDDHWFKVNNFHPLWLYDLEAVVQEAISKLERDGVLKKEVV